MKTWIAPALITFASVLTFGTGVTGQPNATRALVQGNTEFALDLYARLADQKGNLFFSPYSISSALGMTYDGARGNTAAEMQKVLHFPFDRHALDSAFADLIRELQGHKDKSKYNLVVANRLYGQKDYGFLPDFLKVQRDAYGAALDEVDFAGATEAARQAINSWVAKQTHDKIKELIQPGVVNADSRLVLANAIYFKAAWLRPFHVKRTSSEKFFVAADRSVPVPTMHESLRARFFKGESFSVLELPYEERQLSMVVFLPQRLDGLADFEKEFSAANLRTWLAKLSDSQVEVSLPKFKLSAEFQLNNTLMALGMRNAFTANADFSGMSSHAKLAISAVIHKAFIDVDEAGTEAAAATAAGIALTSVPQAATFRADHPFVYLIKDNRTGSVLFLGRLVNPG
jgi:serine protease inhibitor